MPQEAVSCVDNSEKLKCHPCLNEKVGVSFHDKFVHEADGTSGGQNSY